MSGWQLPLLISVFVLHCIENAISENTFVGVKLGEKCSLEKECQLMDPNSQCLAIPSSQAHLSYVRKCACKNNYKLQVDDRMQQCISTYVVDKENDSGDFRAAPIIFCFIACIAVEVVCLLGFRYWKKQRMRREFVLPEYRGTTFFSSCSQACHLAPLPITTFGFNHPLSPVLSGAGPTLLQSSSPGVNISQNTVLQYTQNSPPSYEEATKNCQDMLSLSTEHNLDVSGGNQKDDV